MQKKVVVLSGGKSSERVVSLASGKAVMEALTGLPYNAINLDIDDNLVKSLNEFSPDLVFNALHGEAGENGTIAGLLETMQIPYTHSGIMASSIGINKLVTKHILKSLNIDFPNYKLVTSQEILSHSEIMPYPYVIKPIEGGSSIDINIIFSNSDYQKAKNTYIKYRSVLVEEYISGKELHTAVLFNEAVGTMEIKSQNMFYDYQAKYTEGLAQYIFPAQVNEYTYAKTLQQSLKLHKFLNCKTISRCDFRYNEERNELKMLEINTHPGFTNLSLVPKIVFYKYGIPFVKLVDLIIKDTLSAESLGNINK